MKLHHAASLVLVGWYLMAPPMDKPDHFDTSAPLGRWSTTASFDTAAECTKAQAQGELAYSQGEPTPEHKLMLQMWAQSACIATDDPRLKQR
jgi:hypothetical protein